MKGKKETIFLTVMSMTELSRGKKLSRKIQICQKMNASSVITEAFIFIFIFIFIIINLHLRKIITAHDIKTKTATTCVTRKYLALLLKVFSSSVLSLLGCFLGFEPSDKNT